MVNVLIHEIGYVDFAILSQSSFDAPLLLLDLLLHSIRENLCLICAITWCSLVNLSLFVLSCPQVKVGDNIEFED